MMKVFLTVLALVVAFTPLTSSAKTDKKEHYKVFKFDKKTEKKIQALKSKKRKKKERDELKAICNRTLNKCYQLCDAEYGISRLDTGNTRETTLSPATSNNNAGRAATCRRRCDQDYVTCIN